MAPSEDAGTATPGDTRTRTDAARIVAPGETVVLVGGVLGGIVGAAAFGVLMFAMAPDFLNTSIPAMYGLEPIGIVGWTIHLFHGAALGAIFATIVSRDAVARILIPSEGPPFLGPVGLRSRLTAAGAAYGVAIWAIVPILVIPTISAFVSTDELQIISTGAVESLVGHVVFGTVLGVVYATIVSRK